MKASRISWSSVIASTFIIFPLTAHAQGAMEYGGALSGVAKSNSAHKPTSGTSNQPGANTASQTGASSGIGIDAIETRTKAVNSSQQATKLYQLALQNQHKGNLVEAEKLYRQSFRIRMGLWGFTDPTIPIITNALGEIYKQQGQLSVAEDCFRYSLSALSNKYGPGSTERIDTLMLLGDLLDQQKKYPQSIDCFKQACTLSERKYGLNSKEAEAVRLKLATSDFNNNSFQDAGQLLKQTLQAEADAPNPNNKQLLPALDLYAQVLKKTSNESEAQAVEKRASELRASLGNSEPGTAKAPSAPASSPSANSSPPSGAGTALPAGSATSPTPSSTSSPTTSH